jgi:hypothetical protein
LASGIIEESALIDNSIGHHGAGIDPLPPLLRGDSHPNPVLEDSELIGIASGMVHLEER